MHVIRCESTWRLPGVTEQGTVVERRLATNFPHITRKAEHNKLLLLRFLSAYLLPSLPTVVS